MFSRSASHFLLSCPKISNYTENRAVDFQFEVNCFRKTFRESNSLNPDQARRFCPNCSRMLSTDDIMVQKVNLLLRLQFLYEDNTFQLLSFGAFLFFSKQISQFCQGKSIIHGVNATLSYLLIIYCIVTTVLR